MIRIFGIRHHGPGSANRLRSALEAFQPDCIAVEAPADVQDALPYVSAFGFEPPVALLVYNPGDFSQAVYLPFAEFSPEWQAMRFALKEGITLAAIDLPMQLQFTIDRQDQATQFRLKLDADIDPELARMQLDPMAYMAELAGYADSERWWDVTFEQSENDIAIFDAILEMTTALRDDLQREEDPQTLIREAFMRKRLRQLRKEGGRRIAVVCGAWHAPALHRLDQIKHLSDNARLKGIKKTRTKATWIPWSYDRLSLQRGYQAGVIAPAWYHLLFHHREEVALRWLSSAAQLFREEGLDVSAAHIVDAVRLAETLAHMRNRQVAGIHELQEAAATVFFQGSDRPLELLEKKLVFGEAFGKVPSNVPGVPLQKDLEKSIKTARLSSAYQRFEEVKKTFDLRKETNLKASQLLHRLRLLGIPWGNLQEVSQHQLGAFKEEWTLQWQAEFAIRIIEAGMWGNTILEACSAYTQNQLAKIEKIAALTALVEEAIKAGLPDLIPRLIHRLQNLSASTRDVFHLTAALPALVRTLRYGNVRQTETESIRGLVDEMIPRIGLGLPLVCMGVDEELAGQCFKAILQTDRAINRLNRKEHKTLWHKTLLQIAGLEKAHPILQGGCARILLNKNLLSEEQSGRYLQLALSGRRLSYLETAYWVEGFLYGGGLLLLHQPKLFAMLSEWVDALPEEDFMEVLPLLRRTFAEYAEAERNKLLGLAKRPPKGDLKTERTTPGYSQERAALILPTIKELLGLA